VHLELRCENQVGEVTSPATAVVLLPSREDGAVVLPDPPVDSLEDMVRFEMDRIAREAGEVAAAG
jgi:hypothetical protein